MKNEVEVACLKFIIDVGTILWIRFLPSYERVLQAYLPKKIMLLLTILLLGVEVSAWGAEITSSEAYRTPETSVSVPLPWNPKFMKRSLDLNPSERLELDFTLLDWPYNTAFGGRFPSMQQSLSVTKIFYETAHYKLQKMNPRHYKRAIFLLDALFAAAPLADAWLHEEYHRAVLGRRGMDSFNDVYKFDLLASTIAVSHVKDEDLIRLKREHPAEQVRLSAAGIEGEYQLVLEMEKDRFFNGTPAWNIPLYWLIKINSIDYIFSGTSAKTNSETDQFNQEDGTNIEKRDFTGHDFTAWVYDLHRPDEPYEARGVHPSGIGVDRYIKPSDLTTREFDYLRRQGRLSLLNLLDPNLLGFYKFMVLNPVNRQPIGFNMSAGHILTSFGYVLDINVFLQSDQMNRFVILHNYFNRERWFPGITMESQKVPVVILGHPLRISGKISSWMQPKNQRFDDKSATLGGFVAARVTYPLTPKVWPYLEIEGKTAGWVVGNAYLDPNVSVRMGLSAFF